MTTINIESNEHFIELTREFDKTYKTRTYTANINLSAIWDRFYSKNPMENKWQARTVAGYINRVISQKVDQIFHQNNVTEISLQDTRLNDGHTAKLNTIYMIKKEVLAGGKINDPISISCFPNKTNPVHPGGSRLLLAECYNKKIPVIITDYNKSKVNPNKMKSVDQLDFDFSGKEFIFLIENTKTTKGITYKNAGTGLDIMFKQIQNSSAEADKYKRPIYANVERTFFLKDNSLYINGLLIAEQKDNRWSVTMEERYV